MKIYGADIETVNGEPRLLTITSELDYKKVKVIKVTKKSIMQQFLFTLYKTCSRGHINTVYFHNLNHDLVALFYQDYSVFRSTNFKMKFGENIEVEVFAGNTWFMSINFLDIKSRVYVLDSYRYVFTSLAKIGKQLNFKFQKKEMSKQGQKDLGKKLTPEIIDYAIYDTLAELELANWITEVHQMYNVKHSVSLAHLASEIFKTSFILNGESILQSKGIALNYSIRSYHGGRNGLYIDKCPRMIKGVTEIDIISSYPNAMQHLPNFLGGDYVQTDKFDRQYAGVYRIVANYCGAAYPVLFTDDFKQLERGERVIYCTGYELAQAIKNKEIGKIKEINGAVFIPTGKQIESPLRKYALEFFSKKEQTPKTDSRYLVYKLLMNALYGKFFQRTEEVTYKLNEEGEYIRQSWIKAGGLFQPFIASQITAFARVELNKLEYKYKSIHSSTDSIKFVGKIKEKDLPKGLGGLTKEIYGDCLIFRNKLYVHFNNEVEKTEKIIKLIKKYDNKKFLALNEKMHYIKYALHGYQGNVKQLIEMYERGDYQYTCKRMIKVREAINGKKGNKALQFVEQERSLNL